MLFQDAFLAPTAERGSGDWCPGLRSLLTGLQFCLSGLLPAAMTQARLPGRWGLCLLGAYHVWRDTDAYSTVGI